jgi:hypothetical protein
VAVGLVADFHQTLALHWPAACRSLLSVEDMRAVPHAGLAVAAAVAVFAAGCGNNDVPISTSTPAPSPSSASAGSAAPPTASGGGAASTSPSSPSTHATEFNPPGDIPDNAVFVDHTAPGSRVHFTVPEGWAKSTHGPVTTYTDKYNSISIEVRQRPSAPTVASARTEDVPELQQTAANFQLEGVEMVKRKYGSAVHLTYLADSAPNPVTDKVVRDAVERFDFWHQGEEAILTLAGPNGADNVDPWQTVSDSLQWK